jgi:activator of HSP90 ATPase
MSVIHHEIKLNASPERVYETLTNAEEFSKMSGAPAEINNEVGGFFSCFGGGVTGRNIELVPDKIIVQAWRGANWDEHDYSIVKYELKEQGSGTLLVFNHTGYPEEMKDMIDTGWYKFYWDPMEKYFV